MTKNRLWWRSDERVNAATGNLTMSEVDRLLADFEAQDTPQDLVIDLSAEERLISVHPQH